MSKLVRLNLGRGNLLEGLPFVTAQMPPDAHVEIMQFTGSLPAAPDILDLYRRWHLLCELLYEARHKSAGWRKAQPIEEDIEVDEADVTHVSDAEFSEVCEKLQKRIDSWLDSEGFRPIDRQLRSHLNRTDEIRVILETEDSQLRKLPWHLWQFFKDYRWAEPALSDLEYGPVNQAKPPAKQVRILAILGDSTGINIEEDRRLLENLPEAQVKFLAEPQRQELYDRLWELQGWDILFFAGHSLSKASGETGYININKDENLTIDQLKNALQRAIERGLKLAIFNSCDGLGLGRSLADLRIPQIIVMREPVPDKVAQEFLKYFLEEFAGGKSFYIAVREAREKLQGIEGDFPGASWLPAICQNPAAVPPTWEELCQKNRQPAKRLSIWHSLGTVLVASALITLLVMGVRWAGLLEASELHSYDQLVRMRADDRQQDGRILLVTIGEQDIDFQDSRKMHRSGPLSDEALALLLDKLKPYQPRSIGLDIYHNYPFNAGVAARLKNDDSFFAICKVPAPRDGDPDGIGPPSQLPKERLGFSDFVGDGNNFVRRHLLTLEQDAILSPCPTENAFSLLLATHYLKAEGIREEDYHRTPAGDWKVRNVLFKKLTSDAGGYQRVDASGYQIMLNYRSYDGSPQKFAQQVSLREVLNNGISPNLVKDLKKQVVLIGATASSTADDWFTPYSAGQPPSQKKIPGVFLHGQMVSQILSAVLDGRLPISWWPEWGELIWVWVWSLLGAILAWCLRRQPLLLAVAGIAALGLLFGICFAIFTQATWVPLVPPALALVAAQAAVVWWFLPRPRPANGSPVTWKSNAR